MSSTSFGAQKTTSAGGLSIVEDSWLTGVMSRKVHRVSGTVEEDSETQAQRTLQQITDQPGFSYARVPTHHVRTSRLLERGGFHVVDTGITLETRQLPERGGEAGRARLALAEDQAAVEEIARRSFIYSRSIWTRISRNIWPMKSRHSGWGTSFVGNGATTWWWQNSLAMWPVFFSCSTIQGTCW